MDEITTDWTKAEFKAYLLLYAANANYIEKEEEKEIIRGLVSETTYKEIHRELNTDNDYQSIQKIMYNLEKHDYSKKEINKLMQDIRKVFMADGEFDLLEENMLRALKRLLK